MAPHRRTCRWFSCSGLVLARGVALLLLLGSLTAMAEPAGRFAFRSYGTAEGLENLVVSDITQDGAGLLWVATHDGLYRFDGRSFEHFGVKDGLPSSHVWWVAASGDVVWAGTERGLARGQQGTFVPVRSEDGLTEAPISALALAPDGSLWVASSEGLFRSQEGQRFAAVEGWPGGEPRGLWIDRDGTVYALAGAALYRREAQGAWHREGQEVGLTADSLDSVVRDRAGVLWVLSSKQLWSRAPGEQRFTERSSALPDVTKRLPNQRGRLLAGREGGLWVPNRFGLAHFDGQTWTLIDQARGLPSWGARVAFEDRDGSVWFGSTGLLQLLGRGLWRSYGTSEGLPGKTVWFIGRAPVGTLWVGTDRGLVHETPSGWALLPGTEEHIIRSVAWRKDGSAWASGEPATVFGFDRSGALVARLGRESGLLGDKVFDLHADSEDRLWVATDAGLFESTEGSAPPRFQPVEQPWAGQRIRSLSEDRAGRLWAAGASGLAVRQNGSWRLFTTVDGLRQTAVAYLAARANGELCVSYEEAIGASCFRLDGDVLSELRHLDETSGLSNGAVYFLGEDGLGRLWAGTGNGVDVWTGGTAEHFGQAQGAPGDDCAANAFYAEPEGTVWMGTAGGLGRFDSAAYRGMPPPLPPAIIDARLGARDVLRGARSDNPDQRTLAVHFRVPAFLDALRMEHQVRLTPMEPEWRVSTSDEVHYARLEPGAYTLEFRSRRRPGPWSDPTSISFIIRPAFWETGWFTALLLAVASAGMSLLLVWRGRVVRAKSRQESLARSDANFKALIEQFPDAIFVQREGRLIYVNHAASTLLGGSSPTEKVGTAFDELVHPDDREEESEKTRGAMAPGQRAGLREQRLLRRDGSAVPVEVSSLTAELEDQRVVLVVARDVSEQKQLRRRLAISDRMASLGTLVAGIAHELNNPLAYVISNLRMIDEELREARTTDKAFEDVLEAVRDSRDGAERMRKIVAGLKTFSRGDAESRSVLELGPVLASALKLTSSLTHARAKVVVEEQAVPAVMADEGRVAQVFINLLVNAAQAIAEGDAAANEIRVLLHSDAQGRAVVEIRDTGAGMSPEVLARAFDPFFTTKEVGVGTGLGLSICHGIVTSMGGELTMESTLGKGTRVRMVLPPVS